MKKSKLFTFLLSVSLCFSGCVSQSEYDELNAQLSELQSEMSEKEKLISEKDTKISNLENDIKELEENNNKINNEKIELEEKIDELENGASRLLSDVNNAFEAKSYEKTIQIANDLHKKFNGSEEDIKAQSVANQAQAELDKIEAEKKAEEERKAAEAAKSAQDKAREYIRIGGVNIEEINSADGVSVGVYWRNESKKDIKYLTFTLVPYNAVGDQVYSYIGAKSEARCKITGPLPHSAELLGNREYDFYVLSPAGSWEWVFPKDLTYSYYDFKLSDTLLYGSISKSNQDKTFLRGYFDCIWYNSTVNEVKLTKIEIEYMDGTKVTLDEEEIKYVTY